MLVSEAQKRARALYIATLAEACQTAYGWVMELSQRCGDCRNLGVTCPHCTDIGNSLPAMQRVIEDARAAWNKAERLG